MKLEEELIRCKDWIQSALNKGGNTHDFKDIVDAFNCAIALAPNKESYNATASGCGNAEVEE